MELGLQLWEPAWSYTFILFFASAHALLSFIVMMLLDSKGFLPKLLEGLTQASHDRDKQVGGLWDWE